MSYYDDYDEFDETEEDYYDEEPVDFETVERFAPYLAWSEEQLVKLFKSPRATSEFTLVNGKLVSVRSDGAATYAFELRDEDVYLPEGVEVDLWPVGRKSDLVHGRVVFNQSGTVEILLSDEDRFGKAIDEVRVAPETINFIAKLLDKLQQYEERPSVPVMALIDEHENPQVGGTLTSRTVPDALDELESRGPVAFVWGPPGCSKTYTVARLAKRFIDNGKRVLLLSGANVAVDGACLELYELMKDAEVGTVVRHGYPRDARFKENPLLTTQGIAERDCEDEIEERKQLLKKRKKASQAEREEIDKRLNQIKGIIRFARQRAMNGARFVATSTAMATIDKDFTDREAPAFDVVIYDEAGMAMIPQMLFAGCVARENLYAVGDFRQLPPIVDQSIAPELTEDIYEWCGVTACVDSGHGHPLVTMLSEQRRSHQDIAAFVGARLYANLITTHPDTAVSTAKLAKVGPASGEAITLLDTSGLPARMLREGGQGKKSRSRFNLLHAIIDVQTALVAKSQIKHADSEADVAIVVPYAMQAALVRTLLRSCGKAADGIRCATVHAFQGSSAQAVVFDVCDTGNKLGYPVSHNEGRYADRLFNVALTRARGKVFIVANVDSLDENKYSYLMLVGLVKGLVGTGAHVRGDDLLREVCYADTVMRAYDDADEAYAAYISDLDAAEKRVSISCPEIDFAAIGRVGDVAKALLLAARRGCKVKTEGKISEIPQIAGIDGIDVGTTRSYFPMAILDSSILWFGPALCAGEVISGNKGCATITARIESPRTVSLLEMLMSTRTERAK